MVWWFLIVFFVAFLLAFVFNLWVALCGKKETDVSCSGSEDLVKTQAVSDFLRDDNQNVILIKGGWGTGKTHLWESVSKKDEYFHSDCFLKYSYSSLFGVTSVSQFRKNLSRGRVFEFSKSGARNKWKSSRGTLLVTFLLVRWFCEFVLVCLSRFFKYLEGVPALNMVSVLVNDYSYYALRRGIVCIDDVERRGGELDIKSVCGVVDELVGKMGCKVVIIYNDNEEGEGFPEGLNNSLEKIVDCEIGMSSDSYSHVQRLGLDGLDNQEEEDFSYCFEHLDVQNLRAVYRVVSLYLKCRKYAGDSVEYRRMFIKGLSLFGWAKYCESSPSVEKLKLLFIGPGYLVDDEELPPGSLDKEWKEKIDKVGLYLGDDDVFVFLENIVANGFVDAEVGTVVYSKISKSNGLGRRFFNKLFSSYHTDFFISSGRIRELCIDALENIDESISIGNFDSAIQIFLDVEPEGDVDSYIFKYFDVRRDIVDGLILNGRLPEPDVFSSDRFSIRIKEIMEERVGYIIDKMSPWEVFCGLCCKGFFFREEYSFKVALLDKGDIERMFSLNNNVAGEEVLESIMEVYEKCKKYNSECAGKFGEAVLGFFRDLCGENKFNERRFVGVLSRLEKELKLVD